MSGKSADDDPAKVAERMADAISYLSAVAKNAGLASISSDLLLIGKKLRAKARPEAETTRRRIARR